MSTPGDPGLLPGAKCFSFTPSELGRNLYMYLTWCGHYFCSSEYFMKRQHYPDMLLAYVRNGNFKLQYRGTDYIVAKGEAFLIDCNEPHYYRAVDNLEFLYIHFNGLNSKELCQHIINNQGVIFQGEKTIDIGKKLFSLFNLYDSDEIITAPELSLKVYALIISLLTRPSNLPAEQNPIDISIHYIRDNVGNKITLDELAENVGLSKYYFSHLFKAETGYSPMEYIISTRLDRAKELLKSTNLRISEISYKVGYENPGSFTNLFIKKEGCSPQTFRKI